MLSIPVLYQEESVELQPSVISTAYNQLHLLHLVTMAHIVQVLLSSQGKKNKTQLTYFLMASHCGIKSVAFITLVLHKL